MGEDLAHGLIKLFNGIKSELFIPQDLQMANITSIFKNKGSRLDLKNDRGIFILSIFRKIIDKMVYEDKVDDIDSYMSDSNIGARKDKNVRNHLFVIYAIINSVVQGEAKCIDMQIYDLAQAFDALWLADSMNDLWDTLPTNSCDDRLGLVYQTSVKNNVAINTAVGQTDRVNIPEIVIQGVPVQLTQ